MRVMFSSPTFNSTHLLTWSIKKGRTSLLSSLSFLVYYFNPFSPSPPPSANYFFRNSRTHARFICGTQLDLLSQAHQPSHMLLSLLAESTHDTFVRFRRLHCVHSHRVVMLLHRIPTKASNRCTVSDLKYSYCTLCVKPFAK